MGNRAFTVFLFSVLIMSMVSLPSYSNFGVVQDAFADKLVEENYGIAEGSGHEDDGHEDDGHEDDGHEDDGHDDTSACTLNSLDALAQEFMNNNAYLNFHTDDGVHPQNTGPGDLATPGEIRGNIGPAGTDTYAATINVRQNVLDAVADTTPWNGVSATGTAVFLTGHHSDHIDFEITVNDLRNVSGIHIHLGEATENSHIHGVDLLTSTDSLISGIDHGPIAQMDGTFTGEISLSDLCPGADHNDDGHEDDGHEDDGHEDDGHEDDGQGNDRQGNDRYGNTELGNAGNEDGNGGGHNEWDTRPSFGQSHETRKTLIVDNGFVFNGNTFSLIDNHHTPFEQQVIKIGALNTFAAKVYADKDLKVQEFLFGVPEVGMGHLAEMRVEVWYDPSGEIKEVKLIQNTEVIDHASLSVSAKKTKCLESDPEENCNTTSMSAIFKEPLADSVMAVKAIDFALRDQTTYLNDGFDITGVSLNPMATKMIPSSIKGEGLIEVTQNEKYSDYWSSADERIFIMNSFGSFKQVNQSFERFHDSGNAYTRVHSDFGKIVAYEADRAKEVFDSTILISELPDSFSHNAIISERLSDEVIQQMMIQEEIAQKILDEMDNQVRW